MKNIIYTLLVSTVLSAVPIMASAHPFAPPPVPVCPTVASAGAVQCDLQKRATATCAISAMNPGDFGACMDAFMAKTPFNCALTTPGDKPNCDRANAAKSGVTPTLPATSIHALAPMPAPKQVPVPAAFTPPLAPVCPTMASPAAVQCDLQKRATATCGASARNPGDFGACMDAFMAKTPFNCALTTLADKPNCDRANATRPK